MTGPLGHDPLAAIDRAAALAGVDRLERLAYGWARNADDNDPFVRDPDLAAGLVGASTGQAEDHGYANGFRDAALELLKAIGRGRPCAGCGDPIIDPGNVPAGPDALCRWCGDPG